MARLGTTRLPTIPDSRVARDATDLIRSVETDLLYHHSLRVYSWGAMRGARRGLRYDPELLYVGAMFHDIGLVDGHRSAHARRGGRARPRRRRGGGGRPPAPAAPLPPPPAGPPGRRAADRVGRDRA